MASIVRPSCKHYLEDGQFLLEGGRKGNIPRRNMPLAMLGQYTRTAETERQRYLLAQAPVALLSRLSFRLGTANPGVAQLPLADCGYF